MRWKPIAGCSSKPPFGRQRNLKSSSWQRYAATRKRLPLARGMNELLPCFFPMRTALILVLFVVPALAYAANIDCTQAATPQEKAICSSPELSQADEDMA